MSNELRIGLRPPTKRALRQRSADRARGVQRAKKSVRQCAACGWSPPFSAPGKRSTALHGHHVVPIAGGGDCSEANVLVVCPNHHAVAHLIGHAAYAPEHLGGETPRARLLRLLALADVNPQACAAELVAAGRHVFLKSHPETHQGETC